MLLFWSKKHSCLGRLMYSKTPIDDAKNIAYNNPSEEFLNAANCHSYDRRGIDNPTNDRFYIRLFLTNRLRDSVWFNGDIELFEYYCRTNPDCIFIRHKDSTIEKTDFMLCKFKEGDYYISDEMDYIFDVNKSVREHYSGAPIFPAELIDFM